MDPEKVSAARRALITTLWILALVAVSLVVIDIYVWDFQWKEPTE